MPVKLLILALFFLSARPREGDNNNAFIMNNEGYLVFHDNRIDNMIIKLLMMYVLIYILNDNKFEG